MAEFNINANLNVDGTIAVGTTNPLTKLEVKEAGTDIGVTITNSTEAIGNTSGLYFKETGSASDYRKAAIIFENDGTGNGLGDLHLAVNNEANSDAVTKADAKLTISHEGAIGVGTTNPQSGFKLDVNGSSVFRGAAYVSNSLINFGGTNDFNIETSGLTDIKFIADSSEKMRITSAGNVGIGTTSPTAPLHLHQPSSTGMKFSRSGHDTIELALEGSDRFVINNDTDSSNNLLTLMYDSGNVGIGTTSPDKLLVVSGDGSEIVIDDTDTTDNPRLRFRESGTTSGSIYTDASELIFESGASEKMRIDTTGNVGIGTNNPEELVHIENTLGDAFLKVDSKVGREAGIKLRQSGTFGWDIYSDDVGAEDDKGFNIDAVISGVRHTALHAEISASSKIGIGTITPEERLHVDGNILATGTVTGSNLSGTNTGDQDLSGYLLNTTDTHNGVLTADKIYVGGSEIMASGAQLQVNGFQRTGNIYIHEGGNTPNTSSLPLGNSSGNLQWNGDNVWHAGNLDISNYLLNTTDTFTGSLTIDGDIRGAGTQLVLNGGDSSGHATGQTSEYVYINAESGLQVTSSPDNWATGWAGRQIAYINKADASSYLPGLLEVAGNATVGGKTILDDDLQLKNISTSQSGTVVKGGFLNSAAEDSMVHIPSVINDLAGFNKWGTITTSGLYKTRSGTSGSYTYTNPVTTSDFDNGKAFDASSSTAGNWHSDNGLDGTTAGVGVITLEWTNEISYSCWSGIVFGSGSFTPQRVKIEAFRAGVWQTLCDITDNSDNVVLRQIGSNAGTGSGTTKLRYTLGGGVGGNYFRIHTLYMANYAAGDNNLANVDSGVTKGLNFLEKYKDAFLHGHFRPGADATYDLGVSTYQWKNAYINGFIDMGTNQVSDTTVGNWNTAFGWGDHSLAGYTGDQDLSGYLTTTGKAYDSDRFDGIDSANFIYGEHLSGVSGMPTSFDQSDETYYKAGFWDALNSSDMPDTGWWWGQTFAHRSNNSTYLYGAQVAFKNSSSVEMQIRSMDGGANGSTSDWEQVYHTGNLTNVSQLTNDAGYTGDQDLSGYLLNTTDTLTGVLTVTSDIVADTNIYSHNDTLRIQSGGLSGTWIEANDLDGKVETNAEMKALSFIKNGGTSSQFLKADGSVDSTSYLQLTGGTLSGALNVNATSTLKNIVVDTDKIYSSGDELILMAGGANGTGMSLTDTDNMATFTNLDIDVVGGSITTDSTITATGLATASGFKVPSGTSSQFLKADGSSDSNNYEVVGEFDYSEDTATAYTLSSSDKGQVLGLTSSSAITLTINSGSLASIGDIAYVDQMGSGTVTFSEGTGTLLYNNAVNNTTAGQYSRVAIHKVSSTEYRIFGELQLL